MTLYEFMRVTHRDVATRMGIVRRVDRYGAGVVLFWPPVPRK